MNVTLKQRQDTSYLFSSMNASVRASGGVSDLASLVSDYNTIKNGSYNKLVKAYYAKMDGTSATKSTASSKDSSDTKVIGSGSDVLDSLLDKTKKTAADGSKTTAKEYTKIASDASDVKSALSALTEDSSNSVFKKTNGVVDRDKVDAAVSDFVTEYNTLLKSAGSTDNKMMSSRATSMSGLGTAFRSQLGAIGITAGEDGQLSLDKDKLAAAGTDKIRETFNGLNSFGDRVESAAMLIKSGATTAASGAPTYSADGTTASQAYGSTWSAQV